MPILSNCLLSVNVLSGRKINGCANGHLYDLKICQKQQKRWPSIVNLCLLNRKKEAKAVEQKSAFDTFLHFHRATDFYCGILVCWQIVITKGWPWQELSLFCSSRNLQPQHFTFTNFNIANYDWSTGEVLSTTKTLSKSRKNSQSSLSPSKCCT